MPILSTQPPPPPPPPSRLRAGLLLGGLALLVALGLGASALIPPVVPAPCLCAPTPTAAP